MKKILCSIFAALVLVFSTIGILQLAHASTTTLRYVQTPTINLYSSISSTATSLRVTPYPKDLNGVKLTITDFGSSPTLTIDPKVTNYEEIVGFSAIVDNGDNTATLTGLIRGYSSKAPYTASGTGKTHGASAIVVFSNNPQLYNRLAAKENDESITGLWTFGSTTMPRYDVEPTNTQWNAATGRELVDLTKLNATAIAGASNSTELINGIGQLATGAQAAAGTSAGSTGARLLLPASLATSTCQFATTSLLVTPVGTGKLATTCFDTSGAYTFTGLQTFSTGGLLDTASSTFTAITTFAATTTVNAQLIANSPMQQYSSATTTTSWPLAFVISTSTGKATTGSSLLASSTIGFIGFSQSIATNGSVINLQTNGIVSGFSGLVAGSDYYLQDNGTIGTSVGTLEMYVGTAVSATQIAMKPAPSLQYMGSASISNGSPITFNFPSYAREAIFNSQLTTGGSNEQVDMTIMRIGKTSSILQLYSSAGTYTLTCNLVVATVTCTASNSGVQMGNNTVYFYR